MCGPLWRGFALLPMRGLRRFPWGLAGAHGGRESGWSVVASVSGLVTALAACWDEANGRFLNHHWRDGMMKTLFAVLLVLCAVNAAPGDDVAFRNVKVADAKGKQADASLLFNGDNKSMVVRVADRDFVSIPYDKIDKLSYEYSKKHRITQGAIVMVASLGAGAVVMLDRK